MLRETLRGGLESGNSGARCVLICFVHLIPKMEKRFCAKDIDRESGMLVNVRTHRTRVFSHTRVSVYRMNLAGSTIRFCSDWASQVARESFSILSPLHMKIQMRTILL